MSGDPTVSWGMRSAPARVGLACVIMAVVGCGPSGKPVAPVTGTVSFESAPVTEGSLTFLPLGSNDPGKPATGVIRPDGTFTLGTYAPADGAVIGSHRVVYSAPVGELPPGKELAPGESPPLSRFHGLSVKQDRVEVSGASNRLTIDLVRP